MGEGTTRRAAVADGAGMVGVSGEPEKAGERKLTTEDTESTEEEKGTEIGPGKGISEKGRLVIAKLPPTPLFLRMYGNDWTYGRISWMYGNDWT